MLNFFKKKKSNKYCDTIDLKKDKMTRKEFCELLKPTLRPNSWEIAQKLKRKDSLKIINDIMQIKNIKRIKNTNMSIQLKESRLSKRAMFCYNYSMQLLLKGKIDESLHELHDAVQDYYLNQNESIPDIDYIFIHQWLEIYNGINKED